MRYQRIVIQLLIRIVSLHLIRVGMDDKIDNDRLLIEARQFLRDIRDREELCQH